jgi:hypothetical protein
MFIQVHSFVLVPLLLTLVPAKSETLANTRRPMYSAALELGLKSFTCM